MRDRQRVWGLADIVVPLTYGVGGGASAKIMRQYKDNAHPNVRRQWSDIIACILHLGLALHQRCVEEFIRHPVSATLVVPSTRPESTQPFTALVRGIGVGDAVDGLRAAVDAPK